MDIFNIAPNVKSKILNLINEEVSRSQRAQYDISRAFSIAKTRIKDELLVNLNEEGIVEYLYHSQIKETDKKGTFDEVISLLESQLKELTAKNKKLKSIHDKNIVKYKEFLK